MRLSGLNHAQTKGIYNCKFTDEMVRVKARVKVTLAGLTRSISRWSN
jgi:hypothetical protein